MPKGNDAVEKLRQNALSLAVCIAKFLILRSLRGLEAAQKTFSTPSKGFGTGDERDKP